jgi:hypothetical protein
MQELKNEIESSGRDASEHMYVADIDNFMQAFNVYYPLILGNTFPDVRGDGFERNDIVERQLGAWFAQFRWMKNAYRDNPMNGFKEIEEYFKQQSHNVSLDVSDSRAAHDLNASLLSHQLQRGSSGDLSGRGLSGSRSTLHIHSPRQRPHSADTARRPRGSRHGLLSAPSSPRTVLGRPNATSTPKGGATGDRSRFEEVRHTVRRQRAAHQLRRVASFSLSPGQQPPEGDDGSDTY